MYVFLVRIMCQPPLETSRLLPRFKEIIYIQKFGAGSVLRSQLRASENLSGGVISLYEKPLFTYSARGVSGAFLKRCRRSGIQDLHFRDLRHEATSRLFEKGLNPVEVATITGHKDPRMLMRYTHLRAEDLARKLG